jgi:hypothetical protein
MLLGRTKELQVSHIILNVYPTRFVNLINTFPHEKTCCERV